jgi:hypothetical protein
MKYALRLSVVIVIATLALLTAFSKTGGKESYSFVVAGDDRLAPDDTVGNPSTTNTYHLKRLFAEIAEIKPLPKYLFFNGDLVMGYTGGDTVRLARELREWIKIYKASPLASRLIKLVAIAGNHEVDERVGKTGRVSVAAYERTFVREMKEYIRADNGPKATGKVAGTDSLLTDQTRLCYSFNFNGDHFVIFNTDPVGRENIVPWRWLAKDLEQARKGGVGHIFLFGHKPPFASHYDSESGLEQSLSNRDSMWAVVERYNCDAYFGSHYHLWDSVQVHKGKTWEIICGNGGAPMGKDWTPSYYGYTLVNVGDKEVGITSMGHDVDKAHYTAPTPDKPTTVRAKFNIQ